MIAVEPIVYTVVGGVTLGSAQWVTRRIRAKWDGVIERRANKLMASRPPTQTTADDLAMITRAHIKPEFESLVKILAHIQNEQKRLRLAVDALAKPAVGFDPFGKATPAAPAPVAEWTWRADPAMIENHKLVIVALKQFGASDADAKARAEAVMASAEEGDKIDKLVMEAFKKKS